MPTPTPLTLGAIRAETSAGISRVSTEVDGQPLWFSTSDAVLRPSPEAFATALLMPALVNNRRLVVEPAVCSRWAGNMPTAVELFHEWWQCPRSQPELSPHEDPTAARNDRMGLCFSGGVDSFFSLIRHRPRVDTLVYIHDYDIPIRGHDRPPNFEPWLRKLSEQANMRAIVIHTNLKTHPLFRPVDWFAAHGACLAATGHLLSDRIGTLVLSSSYPRTDPNPSGTHWKLDPLWSSARLNCVHFGESHRRTQKLLDIVHEPLPREFLRVCWANQDDRQNCGECEKCLRTQLILLTCGELVNYPAFHHDVPLADRIDQIGGIYIPDLIPTYEAFIDSGLPLSVEQAVTRLVERSRQAFVRRHQRHEWRRRFDRLLGRPPQSLSKPLST